jgi:hypothetical protein
MFEANFEVVFQSKIRFKKSGAGVISTSIGLLLWMKGK